jgi:hypothetical protein
MIFRKNPDLWLDKGATSFCQLDTSPTTEMSYFLNAIFLST